MNPYEARPWLRSYPAQQSHSLASSHALGLFEAAVASAPGRSAIKYFDGSLSYRDVDQASDAFAAALASRGFAKGDRLGVYLQNVPTFVIALVAAWKLGGIPVPINPMNRRRELEVLFADCRPKALICHDQLFEEVVSGLADCPGIVFTTSPLDYQTRCDPRLFSDVRRRSVLPGSIDFLAAVAQTDGELKHAALEPDDLAFLVYTSGTTGVPKGSMNTHRGATYATGTLISWFALSPEGAVLGLAPLFHITGLICHVLTAFALAAPLILSYRFEPGVMLDAAEEHEAKFSIGAITAYLAMLHHPSATQGKFRSLEVAGSGGAPVPPETVRQWQAKFGQSLANAYGMTETNAPVSLALRDGENRIDLSSGALSIGLPLPGTDIWIADDNGQPAPIGSIGEIVIKGPTIAAGYWQKPAETRETMREDGLRSGDIGFMDQDGWLYLVDRKKDMIVASGYKVWPREVEDVLYTHPAVREAAVIGVPDSYRGETVKAVVSLKPGQQTTPEDIIEFCRDRMAAYKRPRLVEIIPELPKTVTGKILRRSLRGTP